MTEKRFQWIYIKNNTLELRDNGIVKVFNNERLEELFNELADENEQLKQKVDFYKYFQKDARELEKENEQLKSTIAQLIEQNRKNNDLLLSDIRILEKALWCGGCENDYGRLKELRKEFIR